jgi:hypothetical protein
VIGVNNIYLETGTEIIEEKTTRLGVENIILYIPSQPTCHLSSEAGIGDPCRLCSLRPSSPWKTGLLPSLLLLHRDDIAEKKFSVLGTHSRSSEPLWDGPRYIFHGQPRDAGPKTAHLDESVGTC